jgi:hypothetical protein
MKAITNRDTTLGRCAVDVLLEHYVAWRDECHAVWQAYQQWTDSDRGERPLAYAGYLAALEREEHAASTYADHIESVNRLSA